MDPVITYFTTMQPDTVTTTDTIGFKFTVIDPDSNLAKVLIDLEHDGVFDDSMSVSGYQGVGMFFRAFPISGVYQSVLRVVDADGNFADRILMNNAWVHVSAKPVITSFIITPEEAKVGDLFTATITATDADGDLELATIFPCQVSQEKVTIAMSGYAATVQITWSYSKVAQYFPHLRVRDAIGNEDIDGSRNGIKARP
jgi:hypothetical protein